MESITISLSLFLKKRGKLSLNAGQTYCRMLQWEHSAILSTFIKLPFVITIFVLSIFEWPLKTRLTVLVRFAFAKCSDETYIRGCLRLYYAGKQHVDLPKAHSHIKSTDFLWL